VIIAPAVNLSPFRHVRQFAWGAIGAGGAVLTATGSAYAQVPPPVPQVVQPSQGEISRERLTLPPVSTPKFELRIQATEKSGVPKSIEAVQFLLRDVIVEGATAFPAETVNGLFASLKGTRVGLGAVREAATKLEAMYQEKGYFLSRVFIPPQPIKDGVIKITVIEGFIEDITVEGLDAGTQRTVKAALTPLLEHKPIDLPSLERRLLILNDIPGIGGTSVLRQGATLGGSSLIVTLEERPDTYQVAINNNASRILGPWSYGANATLNRPLNLPGSLNIGVNAGGRDLRLVQSVSGRYAMAVGKDGLLASFGVLAAKARPGGSVRPLEIVNDLLTISARARYPFIRSRAFSLFGEIGFSVNRSDTDILGQPLIRDRTTVLDLGLSAQQNGFLNGTTTINASVYQGLPILGALNSAAPSPSILNFDPQFTRVVYSIQRAQPLPARFSLQLSFQGQYTNSKLLSGELVAFGGAGVGRGFDPAAITGDRGYGGQAELRYDVPISNTIIRNAQIYGFVDAARTTSLATVTVPRSSQHIESAGGGLRITHRYGTVDFQGAYALRLLGGADQRANPRALISANFIY
jgi:hemolysin activation/secretion protein